MDGIITFIEQYNTSLIVALTFISIILMVLVIVLYVKMNKLNQRYHRFMKGKHGDELEQVIYDRFEELDILQGITKQNSRAIRELNSNLRDCYSKIGIIKYDAFKEMGGTLSFALTILDDRNNGYILNCMHSREGCYTYVKEIINGDSYITLSEEEKESLRKAINCKSSK